jgi:hypothetical protein
LEGVVVAFAFGAQVFGAEGLAEGAEDLLHDRRAFR